MINLPGGMRAMTMHDGEGHALTDTTAEVRDLAKYAHELRHTDAVFQRTRAAAVAST
ncbi:MAG: hypothetical protein J0H97_02450 [Alphaproteobacteria bacterium]|nr:hypothetical protein [Alphaproteobacteria bacterium]